MKKAVLFTLITSVFAISACGGGSDSSFEGEYTYNGTKWTCTSESAYDKCVEDISQCDKLCKRQ